MEDQIKVEIQISAVGEVTVDGYDDAYKNYEIGRTKTLTKSITLGNLEEMINELFEEVQLTYDNPEHLTAKIVIRAKKDQNKIRYLG